MAHRTYWCMLCCGFPVEANSVESRYSGVLEGWLEDAPDDDHHDEHTLELLKHHVSEKQIPIL